MPHERVFPGVGFKSHMPFFDGETLVFCRSDEPVRREFECGGTIWERMRTNRALAEHFRDLPRSRSIEYRAWKLYYTAWKKREPCRLVTGLPDDAVECSPAECVLSDRWAAWRVKGGGGGLDSGGVRIGEFRRSVSVSGNRAGGDGFCLPASPVRGLCLTSRQTVSRNRHQKEGNRADAHNDHEGSRGCCLSPGTHASGDVCQFGLSVSSGCKLHMPS
jgi:hypothetical protein